MSKLIKFQDFKVNEDEGGGCAFSDGGNGMGAMVSSQPSATPGDVAGATIGSGDIGSTLGTYTKYPASYGRKRKSKRLRGSRKLNNLIECQDFFRYGNSIDYVKKTHCLDCGMSVENDLESKKAHVYSKHWAHPTKNDEEANDMVDNLFV